VEVEAIGVEAEAVDEIAAPTSLIISQLHHVATTKYFAATAPF